MAQNLRVIYLLVYDVKQLDGLMFATDASVPLCVCFPAAAGPEYLSAVCCVSCVWCMYVSGAAVPAGASRSPRWPPVAGRRGRPGLSPVSIADGVSLSPSEGS